MSRIKQELIEAECNAHILPDIHPLFVQALSAFRPQQPQPQPNVSPSDETTTIYGLYANGVLTAVYQHEDTAEYECHIARTGEYMTAPETPTEYSVKPILMYTHRLD